MTDIFRFEIEHIFGKALWNENNPDTRDFLNANGYTPNMSGNQIALFSDSAMVAQIQALPANDPLRKLLLDPTNNWGLTRHDGGAPGGGNQLGKDPFLEGEARFFAPPRGEAP
jgi:hypothetical protein